MYDQPTHDSAQQASWWMTSVLLPIIFLIVGAAIGFLGTWIRDWLADRKTKRSFLKAIKSELMMAEYQCQQGIEEIEGALLRCSDGRPPQFQFHITFFTDVYTSQLGKLADVSDESVLEIIRVYSKILAFKELNKLVNEGSKEAVSLAQFSDSGIAQQQNDILKYERAKRRALSGLKSYRDELDSVLRKIRKLLERLPE